MPLARQHPVLVRTLALAVAGAIACSLAGTGVQPGDRGPLGRTVAKPAAGAAGGGQFTVEIEGAKQGKFKGENTREASKDKIVGLRFDYEIKTPRDAASGLPTGKRQHQPLVISKEWGAASPQLFQAAASNETLTHVTLNFYKSAPSGESEAFYTIKLTNAQIASLKQYTEDGRFYEDVSFTFQKIEVTHVPSKASAED